MNGNKTEENEISPISALYEIFIRLDRVEHEIENIKKSTSQNKSEEPLQFIVTKLESMQKNLNSIFVRVGFCFLYELKFHLSLLERHL